MDIRLISLLAWLLVLIGCSGGSSSSFDVPVTSTQPDPTTPVAGGAVKGPLVGAEVNLYAIDLAASDLKGNLVSTGRTNATAAIEGLTIAAGSLADTFLLEVIADDDTVDLNTGTAPILRRYESVVSSEDIRRGQVFATPITTLVIDSARQSAPFADLAALNSALEQSSRQVISALGFGLDVNVNPFTSNPLLTPRDTTVEQQQAVVAYRLAIEGVSAILNLLAAEVSTANPDAATTVDDVLAAVAVDLSDGSIDGRSGADAVEVLSNVTNLASVVAADPATLMIPGTDMPITQTAELVADETAATGITVSTEAFTSGEIAAEPTPGRVNSDIDGDGVIDREDAFPSDPAESQDTDGDGIGNNSDEDDDGDLTLDAADAFPLNPAEDTDTDGNGIGNNEDPDDDGDGVSDGDDAFPLDNTESVDTDNDGVGNNADEDDDGDGVSDGSDAFPLNANEQLDTDGDGIGNNADEDDDGDGVADGSDSLPLNNRTSAGASGTIGAAGGTLTSADGQMTLTFPAGALARDTLITIATPTPAATDAFDSENFVVEAHYILEPDGTQFAQPVDVSWLIPESRPASARFVYILSDGVFSAPDEPAIVNRQSGVVTAKISHFSELFVEEFRGAFDINEPLAALNETLTWTYEFELDELLLQEGVILTEGAFITDFEENLGTTRQPVVIAGEATISAPLHEQLVFCEYEDIGEQLTNIEIIERCRGSRQGTIVATCQDSSEDGLEVTIGFNLEFGRSPFDDLDEIELFLPENRSLYPVEAKGECVDAVEITEPRYIEIGIDVDRIERTPIEVVIPECGSEPDHYSVVVSNTRTSLIGTSGCSRDLNFPGGDNQVFGAELLVAEDNLRLFQYGESGVFVVEPQDGFFGQLLDFQRTTTDVQHGVNTDGSIIPNQAYSVNNAGTVFLRTLNGDGTNGEEEAFNSVGLTGEVFIGYAPLTPTSGVGISSGTDSRAYFVVHGSGTPSATDIGSVGDTALGIECTRLICDDAATACSVTNTETFGCAVTAFESEELYTFYSREGLLVNTPTMNFTTPTPGRKTASPFVRSNSNGQMVTATVNEGEVGRVVLVIEESDGSFVQEVEFFLTDANTLNGFVDGVSIELLEPSAEYPNGAVRVGVRNPSGNDGVLTIPATEALLGTSPEPFFGRAFDG